MLGDGGVDFTAMRHIFSGEKKSRAAWHGLLCEERLCSRVPAPLHIGLRSCSGGSGYSRGGGSSGFQAEWGDVVV